LGSRGFIGGELVKKALARRFDVYELNREKYSENSPIINIKKLDIEKSVENLEPHYVIDCIGIKSYYYKKSQLRNSDLNATLASYIELIETIKNNNSRMIFISSGGAIYKQNQKLEAQSNNLSEELSAYGLVNLALENLILERGDNIVIRGSNVFGSHRLNNERQGLITEAFFAALEERPIKIDSLLTTRDYIHIDDFVEIVLRLIDKGVSNEVINVGTGVGTQSREILRRINSLVAEKGCTLDFEFSDNKNLATSAVLDISQLRLKIGDYKFLTISEGLKKNWNLIKIKNNL